MKKLLLSTALVATASAASADSLKLSLGAESYIRETTSIVGGSCAETGDGSHRIGFFDSPSTELICAPEFSLGAIYETDEGQTFYGSLYIRDVTEAADGRRVDRTIETDDDLGGLTYGLTVAADQSNVDLVIYEYERFNVGFLQEAGTILEGNTNFGSYSLTGVYGANLDYIEQGLGLTYTDGTACAGIVDRTVASVSAGIRTDYSFNITDDVEFVVTGGAGSGLSYVQYDSVAASDNAGCVVVEKDSMDVKMEGLSGLNSDAIMLGESSIGLRIMDTFEFGIITDSSQDDTTFYIGFDL